MCVRSLLLIIDCLFVLHAPVNHTSDDDFRYTNGQPKQPGLIEDLSRSALDTALNTGWISMYILLCLIYSWYYTSMKILAAHLSAAHGTMKMQRRSLRMRLGSGSFLSIIV
jgi:hypothetical protein